MACSRMPKCSVRPYGPPLHILVWWAAGMKLGSPSIVVLLLSARSAEPPHSSGSAVGEGGRAPGRRPCGWRWSWACRPSPSGTAAASRSSPRAACGSSSARAARRRTGCPRPRRRRPAATAACASRPRSMTSRACSSTSSSTLNLTSGGKPRISLVLAISSSPRAEPWALPVFCLVGAGQPMIVRTDDERRLVGDLLGLVDRGLEGDDVLAGVDVLDVPAVGLVAGGDVLAERDGGVVLDGDVVVVVEEDEVAQLLVPGERGRLAGDALLHAAVAGDDVDVVVERRLARRGVGVEQAALAAGGHGHADAVGHALAERAGGDLDAGGVVVLGVARACGTPRCAATRGR